MLATGVIMATDNVFIHDKIIPVLKDMVFTNMNFYYTIKALAYSMIGTGLLGLLITPFVVHLPTQNHLISYSLVSMRKEEKNYKSDLEAHMSIDSLILLSTWFFTSYLKLCYKFYK